MEKKTKHIALISFVFFLFLFSLVTAEIVIVRPVSNVNVNSSNFWDNLDIPNSTQMDDVAGTLTISESWLDTFIGANTNTFNATYDLWAYNQTTATYELYNDEWISTYNETYDLWAHNQTILSTYNSTYDLWSYNQTILSTYNESYDNHMNANFSNSSSYWDNLDTFNATQMEDNGGVLNILESWFNTFLEGWCKLTGCEISGDLNVTGNLNVNGNNVSFTQINETMLFWAERATITASSYWAMGNGQIGYGLPIPSDDFTAGNMYISCHGAVDNQLDVELYVNQASSGCIVNYTAPQYGIEYTYCGIDLDQGDQIGCYVLVEDATYTNCVCSVELIKDLGSVAGIKGEKGEDGADGGINTDEVSTADASVCVWNGTDATKIGEAYMTHFYHNGTRNFGIGYTFFEDYVYFGSEPQFQDGIRVDNYANFYDNADHHNYDIENVGTIYATYLDSTYLTYSLSDPEIVGWFPTTRAYVQLFAQLVFAYEGGVINYFNNDNRCYEIFEPSTGNFYKDKCLKDLEIVEQVDPIINSDVEDYYKVDPLTGDIIQRKRPKFTNTHELKGKERINDTTGELYNVTK